MNKIYTWLMHSIYEIEIDKNNSSAPNLKWCSTCIFS